MSKRVMVSLPDDMLVYLKHLGAGRISTGIILTVREYQGGASAAAKAVEQQNRPPKKSHPDSIFISRDDIDTSPRYTTATTEREIEPSEEFTKQMDQMLEDGLAKLSGIVPVPAPTVVLDAEGNNLLEGWDEAAA